MLENWLDKNSIALKINVKNYQQAIRCGGELLVSSQKASKEYVNAMIEAVKDLGPYMVIAPGIAIPHARPEDGAKAVGLSLVTLAQPVNFGNKENDPVDLVICLCSTDSSSHLEALKRLVALLSNAKDLEQIQESDDPISILNIIKKY